MYEILIEMNPEELDSLRKRFEERENALDEDDFVALMKESAASKGVEKEDGELVDLFNDIDVNGDTTVSWDEFTMYLINNAVDAQKHRMATAPGDVPIKSYSQSGSVPLDVPGSMVRCKHIPYLDKLLTTTRCGKYCKVSFRYQTGTMPVWKELEKTTIPVLAAEYIPPTAGISNSHVLVTSGSDSCARFFTIEHSVGHRLAQKNCVHLSESQTVLKYGPRFKRLFMASRSGVLSVYHPDEAIPVGRERLHDQQITDLLLTEGLGITASVDGAVKIVNIEKSMVKHTLEGHDQGVYHLELHERHQLLFSVGFEPYPLVWPLVSPRKPFKLIDKHRPHHGTICSIYCIPGTPQLITADKTGMCKIWDIRTNTVVQNITTMKDDALSGHSSSKLGDPQANNITALGYIPSSHQIVLCGRDVKLFQYQTASNPQLSDDTTCTLVVHNTMARMFLSVHHRTFKLWDEQTAILNGTFPDALPSDITCICLSMPRMRKFFAGTLDGKLYVFGFTSAQLFQELPAASTSPSEVVYITHVPEFRENPNPYVLTVYKHNVALIADVDEHVRRASLKLICLDEVLSTCQARCAAMTHTGCVVVSTNNSHIHVVDMATFTLSFSYRGNLMGDVQHLTLLPIENTNYLTLICTDGSGAINVLNLRSTNCDEVARWDNAAGTTVKDTLDAAERARQSSESEMESSTASGSSKPRRGSHVSFPKINRRSSGEKRGSKDKTMDGTLGVGDVAARRFSTILGLSVAPVDGEDEEEEEEESVVSMHLDLGSRPNSAVAGYLATPKNGEAAKGAGGFSSTPSPESKLLPTVTCIVYLEKSGVLITGDEKGWITVWDVQPHIASSVLHVKNYRRHKPPPPPNRSCVALNQWPAHNEEVTALSQVQVRDLGDEQRGVVIASAARDKRMLLWTLDGVCLGNFAQGRQAFGASQRGVMPYELFNPPADAWKVTSTYLEERDAAQPNVLGNTGGGAAPMSFQRNATMGDGLGFEDTVVTFNASSDLMQSEDLDNVASSFAFEKQSFFVTEPVDEGGQTMPMIVEPGPRRSRKYSIAASEISVEPLDEDAELVFPKRFEGLIKREADLPLTARTRREHHHARQHPAPVVPQTARDRIQHVDEQHRSISPLRSSADEQGVGRGRRKPPIENPPDVSPCTFPGQRPVPCASEEHHNTRGFSRQTMKHLKQLKMHYKKRDTEAQRLLKDSGVVTFARRGMIHAAKEPQEGARTESSMSRQSAASGGVSPPAYAFPPPMNNRVPFPPPKSNEGTLQISQGRKKSTTPSVRNLRL